MDRTVPRTGSEEIELYIRTYYSLLRSTTEIQIRALEETHANMGSALHSKAHSPSPDIPTLIYTGLRLPACIAKVKRVILGQNREVLKQGGFDDVETWQEVAAPARRRRSYFDGKDTLACYIASRSDIDDLLPILTAFQIEWNKMHKLLRGEQVKEFLQKTDQSEEDLLKLAEGIGVTSEALFSLSSAWGDSFWPLINDMAKAFKRLKVRLLAGSLNDYKRATHQWWEYVEHQLPSLVQRPVYFVSSNTHSLVNLITGFALRHEKELLGILDQPEHADLAEEWREIESQQVPSSRENFLYYVLKKYETTPMGERLSDSRLEAEAQCCVHRVRSEQSFDLDVQLIELASIRFDQMDPRLKRPDLKVLEKSDAVVVNIDYPLGMAAYLVLSHIAARVGRILGVYIMGKAASLNGAVGDVMMPAVVYDEHSQNTFLFQNCFSASSMDEDLQHGTVLDNQKAVSVVGTFLQTPTYMDVFYREGYTDIEMEAGPYLSAIYEMYRPKRHPTNEIVDLHGLPFDLGILHYASDTPLSKGINLGAGSMSYYGMDPTYATSLAILRHIMEIEIKRLGDQI
ncbi:MAG: hypothetical protein PVI78_13250 [Anaerolineales bacterium]|jgi:hypothetical protein